MSFLFTFRATQPPEMGAMAKITPLHRVAYEKATPSSGLTSLGRRSETGTLKAACTRMYWNYKSSWNTNRAHLPTWTSFGNTCLFCILLWSAKFGQTVCRTSPTVCGHVAEHWI
ncbi:hypothetical protein AVEN_242052-1 [Araneus ventricosus]|uniref:Uncharacterized protein n=1 Tax=Araneus ventricosus TaxID=182803 RepID=A0A4Y2QAF7_ARAVE|nr:hypothetical protein AVEN_242052-1 [Araneus ventricosus]